MTMNEIKKAIIKAFKRDFGFAPATMKAIVPLESSGYTIDGTEFITWVAFAVGRIGYTYDKSLDLLEKCEGYDLKH